MTFFGLIPKMQYINWFFSLVWFSDCALFLRSYEKVLLRRVSTRRERSSALSLSLPRKRQLQEKRREFIRSKSTSVEEKSKYMIYSTPIRFVPLVSFVWAEPNFRSALDISLSDLCVISGTSEELRAEPKDGKVSDRCYVHIVIWLACLGKE